MTGRGKGGKGLGKGGAKRHRKVLRDNIQNMVPTKGVVAAEEEPQSSVFSPSSQHVGYPFLFAPANHPDLYTGVNENEKYRKLMLKKQKRVSRKDKNVLSEFKSEEIAGHKFEDLDSVLQSLGEDKGNQKSTLRKTKMEKTEVITESAISKKDSKVEEGSKKDEDTAKEEDRCKELEGERDRLKLKLVMEEKELNATKEEDLQTRVEIEALLEEQRRSRRREEQLRARLAEEGRSSEAMKMDLMKQVAEEEESIRQLEQQMRQDARVAQAFPRVLEAATRPGAAHTKEEQGGQEARVALSSRNLGAIPKTRAATTKQASSKMPGASLSPSGKAQRSVERMVGLLEERGRLASLPTPSLRRLVAQLRARLGGLSDLSLSHVEQEVARMAREEGV